MEAQLVDRFRRQRLGVLTLLFLAYVGFYFCRVTFNLAKPELQEEFQLNEGDTGLILSTYIGVYAVSKLVHGVLGDKLGGRFMLLLGMTGAVACNVLFGFGKELVFFLLVWSANAFFQAAGWPGMITTMAQWFPSRESGRGMGVLSLSYQLGDALARVAGGALILAVGWAGMFWVHAALLAAVAGLVWARLRTNPGDVDLPDVDTYAQKAGIPTESLATPADPATTPYLRQVRRFFGYRPFWFLCATYFAISILRYAFWNWSVDYLEKNTAMATGEAAMASAVYPLCGAAGTLMAGWLSDRIEARRGQVVVGSCLLLVPAIYLFSQVPGNQPTAILACLGLVGFLIYGPYALMAGAMAIDLGSRHSASTVAGILDAVGGLGAILAGWAAGLIILEQGWSGASEVVVYVSLATLLVSLGLWNFRPLPHEASP